MGITLPVDGEPTGFANYCQGCTVFELEESRCYSPPIEEMDTTEAETFIWCRHSDACERMARRCGVMKDE